MHYEKRQRALRSWIRRKNLDALLVTNITNVRYLCGFTGSNGSILMGHEEAIFLTDGRYRDQAANEVVGMPINVAVAKSLPRQLAPFLPSRKPYRLGFEADVVTVLQHGLIGNAVPEKVQLEPIHSAVQKLRMHKEADEIALIRRAAALTLSVFEECKKNLVPGVSELKIQRLIRDLFADAGADGEAFESIVLFGKRTALVHGKPSDACLAPNDLILMDFGAQIDGYCADFTRTFTFGKPSKTVKDAFKTVKGTLEAAQKKFASGTVCSSLEALVRERFRKAGVERKYLHTLGHGVGLQIHEGPRLNLESNQVLHTGMVVTVEPGLYSAQWGGIRLENLIFLSRSGPEILTPAVLELEIDR